MQCVRLRFLERQLLLQVADITFIVNFAWLYLNPCIWSWIRGAQSISITGTDVIFVFEFVLHWRLRCLILRKDVLFVIRIIPYWFQIIEGERTSLNCWQCSVSWLEISSSLS
jgi:hypothetical protein